MRMEARARAAVMRIVLRSIVFSRFYPRWWWAACFVGQVENLRPIVNRPERFFGETPVQTATLYLVPTFQRRRLPHYHTLTWRLQGVYRPTAASLQLPVPAKLF